MKSGSSPLERGHGQVDNYESHPNAPVGVLTKWLWAIVYRCARFHWRPAQTAGVADRAVMPDTFHVTRHFSIPDQNVNRIPLSIFCPASGAKFFSSEVWLRISSFSKLRAFTNRVISCWPRSAMW